MVRETALTPAHLIVPAFVLEGRGQRRAISSMPGQFQFSVDELLKDVARQRRLGLMSTLLFGLPKSKDATGSQAWAAGGVVQRAVRAIKKEWPDHAVFTDLCFCEYTSHGHCGVLRGAGAKISVDNDATLRNIQKTALAQARAGADFVAPSGMMDGAVAAIRAALDKNGFRDTGILAYSAKYASVFYGPFRDAAGSAPQFGDRRSYQMDPSNAREALRELRQDVEQGADMVMVKPALSYLDVIARIRPELDVPLVAYNVSGEYAMVKAAEKQGWLDGASTNRAALEIVTSIRRAGADLIITYHATDIARQLA
jgi:porphobilinogen synthase